MLKYDDDSQREITKINALLRFYFKIQSPESLEYEDWLKRWQELKYALEFEKERNSVK